MERVDFSVFSAFSAAKKINKAAEHAEKSRLDLVSTSHLGSVLERSIPLGMRIK